MSAKAKKSCRIFLEDWQMRMVEDHLGTACDFLEIPLDHGPHTKYGVRPSRESQVKNMYLTDEQMTQMKDELGTSCNFIELSKDASKLLYFVPV